MPTLKKMMAVLQEDYLFVLVLAAVVTLEFFDKGSPLMWVLLIIMALYSVFSFSLDLSVPEGDQPDDVAEAVEEALAIFTTDSVRDVLRERTRQITEECHTEERDDEYIEGELAQAGACYAIPSKTRRWLVGQGFSLWPFSSASCKPSENTRRDLVKAAALIIAEIDRLDRAAKKTGITHSHGIV